MCVCNLIISNRQISFYISRLTDCVFVYVFNAFAGDQNGEREGVTSLIV